MNNITVAHDNLPANIEELSKFVLVGREKLVAVRAEIRAIDKVGLAREVRKQKVREGQDIGEAILDAEVRIGELTVTVPKASGGDRGNQYTGGKNDSGVVFGKSKKDIISDAGFTPRQVERFQQLAANPDLVAKAKAEARENDDIVSRSRVLDMVKEKKQKEKAAKRAASLSELKDKGKDDGNVMNGDCIAEMEKLPDGSIDCVITDPPYGINYVSNHRVIDSEVVKAVENDDLDSALALWERACEVLSRKMKPDSHIYIFTSWKVYPKFVEITSRYFRIKNCLIWEKNNWSMGDLDGNYAEQYEMAIFATKGNRKLNGGRDTNILHFNRVASGSLLHSCEKPVDMLRFLIGKSSNPGELVVDPFAGSGSTLVACKQEGRRYWGCEFDTENYKIALGRLANGN